VVVAARLGLAVECQLPDEGDGRERRSCGEKLAAGQFRHS
jgi:hypothetical protein